MGKRRITGDLVTDVMAAIVTVSVAGLVLAVSIRGMLWIVGLY